MPVLRDQVKIWWSITSHNRMWRAFSNRPIYGTKTGFVEFRTARWRIDYLRAASPTLKQYLNYNKPMPGSLATRIINNDEDGLTN